MAGREWLADAIENSHYDKAPRPDECGHSHPGDHQQAVDGTWWCLGCGGGL